MGEKKKTEEKTTMEETLLLVVVERIDFTVATRYFVGQTGFFGPTCESIQQPAC